MICISRCLFIKVTICMTWQNMFFPLITKWCIKPRNGSWNFTIKRNMTLNELLLIGKYLILHYMCILAISEYPT